MSEMETKYVQWAENSLVAASKAIVPGAYPVELLPFLQYMPRWFPGTNFHKLVDRYRTDVHDLRVKPHEALEVAFVSLLLSSCQRDRPDDRFVCGSQNNGTAVAGSSVLASMLARIRDSPITPDEKAEQRTIAGNVAANAYSGTSENYEIPIAM